MSLEWSTGALAEGLGCYRNGEFFLAHEHWESVWLQCVEPEKAFLQALIQIAAAFHHRQRGNLAGTASLLRAALHKLNRYPDEFEGVAVEPLRTNLHAWLEALDGGEEALPLDPPKIR